MKRLVQGLSVALLGWCLGAAQLVQAQNPAMSLIGNVQSDERKPLPGAAITVIHLPSGVRHAAASDGAGRFVIGNLMAGGPYLIRVGEGGYLPQIVENIFLENGKNPTFTVTLSKLTSTKDRKKSGNFNNSSTFATVPAGIVGGSIQAPPAATPQPSGGTASQGRPSSAPGNLVASAAPAAQPAAAAAARPLVPAAAPAARYNRYPARRPSTRVSDPIVPGHYDAKSGNYIYETGQPTSIKLPTGEVIAHIGVNSTESNLHRFLTNPQAQVDTMDLTKGWYNFDRVFFDSGKATLTAESISQLRNIAALLRAYPKSRIKLGGYTDSTGAYRVNKLLSEARAHTAWAALVDMGINPNRIEARGYGPRYSISANSTEAGRAMNRRLSVKVLEK